MAEAQKHRATRSGWFSGSGAGNTEQNRCTSSDARSAKVLGSTSAWFASSTQQCTALRIAADASSTVATESGTEVSSTGRMMGGGCDSPASASTRAAPPSASAARRPNSGDAHAAAGHRVSGVGDAATAEASEVESLPPDVSPASAALAGNRGGGNSAGRRSAATRWSTPSTHRIARARVSGSTAGAPGAAAPPAPAAAAATPASVPGGASASASACFPAVEASARHAHSSAAAGAAASLSPGTCDRSCSADSRSTWRTPISTSASARRGDTPGETATSARAASSARRAHEASPPRDLAVSGATSVSSLETNEAFFGIPESAPAAGPACAFENWRDAALRSWYADAMSGLLFRSGSTLA